MANSYSPLSYADIAKVCDRALENGRGIQVKCDTIGYAHHLRQRCYEYRLIDRAQNAKTYEEEHPMHNRSVYDALIFRPAVMEDGTPVLEIEVSSPERFEERIVEL